MINNKIIQIIPAPENLFAAYKNTDDGSWSFTKVVCIGLKNDGSVVPMELWEKDCDIDKIDYFHVKQPMQLVFKRNDVTYTYADGSPMDEDYE